MITENLGNRVQDSQFQSEVVNKVTDFSRFSNFYLIYFDDCESGYYLNKLKAFLSETDPEQNSPDYFRLLSTATLLVAQFGFDSMNGHIFRYKREGWRGISAFDPRCLLELSVYMAKLNCQAYPVKDKISREFTARDRAVSEGIWGVVVGKVSDGRLPERVNPDLLVVPARERYRERRPICLTDWVLNHQLSALNFIDPQSVFMSKLKLELEVLPQFDLAFKDFLDIKQVFGYQLKDPPQNLVNFGSTSTAKDLVFSRSN